LDKLYDSLNTSVSGYTTQGHISNKSIGNNTSLNFNQTQQFNLKLNDNQPININQYRGQHLSPTQSQSQSISQLNVNLQ
jgi:hypothetical protein